MTAIYTWHISRKRRWLSIDFEIRTLIVSLNRSATIFKNVTLYTDCISLKELQKYMFPHIEIVIKNRVEHDLWIVDKVNTYYMQKEPFIHIDADFIFLKYPKEKALRSEMAFQSLDNFSDLQNKFYTERIRSLINYNILAKKDIKQAFNLGIYVCNNLEVNKKYCEEVFRIAEMVIEKAEPILAYNTVVEQYVMSYILAENNIKPCFLLENYNEEKAKEIGFIHVLNNKNNKQYFESIKRYEEI